ncbi:tyrosine-type recombinase/integrase [Kitasatospora sp. NBC_00315]|uniref:tyrosine-type recombinase/integrase n=1 Tax=Kitasatospora sp. NBC_00315 TaxID=2975963 RepID=UPI00324BCBB5
MAWSAGRAWRVAAVCGFGAGWGRRRPCRCRTNAGDFVLGDLKFQAGRRPVGIPPEIVPDFELRLRRHAAKDDAGLLFIGERGAPFRRSTFGRKWRKARTKLGMDGFRFYDLRHTGNVLAAGTGASLKDLMAHMGHSAVRAALIYQHATAEQQTKIPNGISAAVVDIRTRRRQPTPTDTTADVPRRA